jgi:hypothetical protein
MPSVESITDDSLESNCSIIENIPPKGVSFADFMLIFAMPLMNFICYIYDTKLSVFLTWQTSGQHFVAQSFI